jgi:hypothetical protein
MKKSTGILMRFLLGILGVVILAIGGSLILFNLHWIIWNSPGSLNPPSPIAWLVYSSPLLGFFLLGVGAMMIIWSRPT